MYWTGIFVNDNHSSDLRIHDLRHKNHIHDFQKGLHDLQHKIHIHGFLSVSGLRVRDLRHKIHIHHLQSGLHDLQHKNHIHGFNFRSASTWPRTDSYTWSSTSRLWVYDLRHKIRKHAVQQDLHEQQHKITTYMVFNIRFASTWPTTQESYTWPPIWGLRVHDLRHKIHFDFQPGLHDLQHRMGFHYRACEYMTYDIRVIYMISNIESTYMIFNQVYMTYNTRTT